jgi:ATP-dependent Lon protease
MLTAPMNVQPSAARKADRDLALQLQMVRALASVDPQPGHDQDRACATSKANKTAQDCLAVSPTSRPEAGLPHPPLRRSLFRDEDMSQRLTWAQRLRADAREGVLTALQRASTLGPMRRVGVPGSRADFDKLRGAFPHFKEVLDYVWRRAVLCCSMPGAEFHVPPVLLAGAPGVGKTAFAEALANWLGVPITRVDMSALDTSFRLTGLDSAYSTGKAGVLWEALQCDCLSPVLVLDELDKARALTGEGLTFLLGLLEPLTARQYQDAFVTLPVDASRVQWIATCNDVNAIEAPVLSRFRIFDIEAPKGDERGQVVESVYRALREREPWAGSFPTALPRDLISALLHRSAREIRQALEDACASAIVDGRRELHVEDLPLQRARKKQPVGFVGEMS